MPQHTLANTPADLRRPPHLAVHSARDVHHTGCWDCSSEQAREKGILLVRECHWKPTRAERSAAWQLTPACQQVDTIWTPQHCTLLWPLRTNVKAFIGHHQETPSSCDPASCMHAGDQPFAACWQKACRPTRHVRAYRLRPLLVAPGCVQLLLPLLAHLLVGPTQCCQLLLSSLVTHLHGRKQQAKSSMQRRQTQGQRETLRPWPQGDARTD